VRPVAAVAQAGVLDLHRGHEEDLGHGAVAALLGRPDANPERYAAASPAALAPLGVDQLLVHGTADDVVPVTQSRIHAALDPRAELAELDGGDHFDVIDPSHTAWRDTVAWLSRRLTAGS
jgi:pimeloyl-ACP methyl ester carboxylesterase